MYMLCNRSMKFYQSNVHIVHPNYLSSQSGDVVRASDDLELSLKTSRIEQLYIQFRRPTTLVTLFEEEVIDLVSIYDSLMEAYDKEGITEARYPLGQRGRAAAQISYHYHAKYVGLTEYRKDEQSGDMVRKTGVNLLTREERDNTRQAMTAARRLIIERRQKAEGVDSQKKMSSKNDDDDGEPPLKKQKLSRRKRSAKGYTA